MEQSPTRIAITGGAGQIAYSLVFRIANGDLLGPFQPVALHLLETPEVAHSLEGVKMELEDCAFPLLKEVRCGSDPYRLFEGVHYALLIGSKPRGPGMERSDLLRENGQIFVEQGKALNATADPHVKVLVVGNPCNTNCLIALHHAPRLPRTNFHAMTRLDQNRALFQLSRKAEAPLSSVQRMTIWGNHSSTQVPDYFHASISGKPARTAIPDSSWFEETFLPTVQKRGAAVIQSRGKSSAASAANAAIDALRALITPTPEGDWFSSGVYTAGNPYGIDDNLVFSFPCRSSGDGNYQIVAGLKLEERLETKIRASMQELIEERNLVAELLKATSPK